VKASDLVAGETSRQQTQSNFDVARHLEDRDPGMKHEKTSR